MYTEKRRISNLAYKARNREETNRKQNETRALLRQEALNVYGRLCAHCGFDNELALQIDHTNNDGWRERQALGGQNNASWHFYMYLKSEGWPKGYQTLCANCNIIKHRLHVSEKSLDLDRNAC